MLSEALKNVIKIEIIFFVIREIWKASSWFRDKIPLTLSLSVHLLYWGIRDPQSVMQDNAVQFQ